jgi:replication factor C subunit 2/4
MDNIPWIDKYRPRRLAHIVQQTEVVKVLKSAIKTGELPHMLLYGPPGTGKTSTILAMAYELFGPKNMADRVIELNASDDRGINIVRDKIITFAKQTIGNVDPKFPSPPYKIVILDEADAMTNEAQAALRQIIETTSHITRFCFICNYIDKIIDPIASRCIKFRFKPIDKSFMTPRLTTIADMEHIKISKEAIDLITEISEGDARRSIMILQYVKYLNKMKPIIMPEDIEYITGSVDDKTITHIWNEVMTNDILKIQRVAKDIKRYSYPIPSILLKLKMLVQNSDAIDSQKGRIMIELSNAEARLLEGANEYLQIFSVLALIGDVLIRKKKTVSTKS